MKTNITIAALALALGICACNKQDPSEVQTQKIDSTPTQKKETMKNLISIVEIPTSDFPRAVKFYQAILSITIQEMQMDGVTMGVLPNAEGTVNVVLANGADYKPTTDGAVLYLNAGDDLQPMLDKVKQNGGQVIVPKTQISPEMGFFALFIDTEGNKMGLHSQR
jgi:predicted enzyme related to lactoylglutathione lyase